MLTTWARRQLHSRLEGLREGRVTIREEAAQNTFGPTAAELAAEVRVRHPRFHARLMLGGALGAGESYVDGDWECDELVELIRIFVREMPRVNQLDRGLARWGRFLGRLRHLLRRNTPRGSRRNISAHYDLGNDFYERFLDDTLSYSSGVFLEAGGSNAAQLHEAQLAKLDRICRKLDLRPGDRLLEIGTGWGGLALFAAEQYGCRVTTTTISRAQYERASARVAERGLESRVTVLNRDYRDLQGTFDKLVSIEMIEAVGSEFFDTFFAQCRRHLASDGMMLLQAIVMNEQDYAAHLRNIDFIRLHVFPGGCLPSVGAMLGSVGRATDFRPLHLEDLAPHYTRTLLGWRERLFENGAEIAALGYSTQLLRLWDYYLAYCAAAFAERRIGVVQLLLARPESRHDPLATPLPSVGGRESGVHARRARHARPEELIA